MKRLGFITAVRSDEPFTHMAGDQRWDLRVTITYRDAPSAVVVGGAFDKAFEAAKARLYPDSAKLDADETRRFALLDEHWDVIVVSGGGSDSMKEKFERHRQPWRQDEIQKLHMLAGKGMSLRAIAKALTRSEESVRDRARADGVKIAKLR